MNHSIIEAQKHRDLKSEMLFKIEEEVKNYRLELEAEKKGLILLV